MCRSKWSVSVVALVAVAMLAGCAAPRKATSEKTVFEILQEKANEITAAGGLAAVGIGESKVINTALDRAKNRGRAELARMIEVKLDNLQKDFSEEIGEDENSEYNSLFSNATKLLTSQVLRGSVPRALKYDRKGSMTVGYALMVQDPKVVADAFANQANTQRHLYTRFRASQAFDELDKEVKKFEEFKQKDGLVVQ